MSPTAELKQKRGAAAEQLKALHTLLESEKRALKPEELIKHNAYMDEIRGYNETISAMEANAAVQAAIADQRGIRHEQTGLDPEQQRARFNRFVRDAHRNIGIKQPSQAELAEFREAAGSMDYFDAFGSFLRNGPNGLTPEERTLLGRGPLDALQDFARGNAYSDLERRAAQSDVTGNLGAFTVPQGFLAELQIALKYYAGMMEVGCREITTTTGNDLPMPTTDDTGVMGRRLAENQPITNTAVAFGQVILKAWKYSSDLILIPVELLQDTGIDLEAELIQLLAIRIGRIYNNELTLYGGSNGPIGVTVGATTGATTTVGHLGQPQYADLVNLKYSVNRSYRMGAKWMMNDNTLADILKLVDSNGRPLILDYLTTLQEDEPEKLLGQPIVINNDMADPGTAGSPVAGNICVLYGAWRNYWIRQVRAFTLLRLVERYADNLQVGFIGFSRLDGRLVDAGQHPIKALVSATS